MQILVVDDQATNRVILTCLLEDEGHKVFEAENGLIAVELYEKHDIDIVLMDVIMPIMDGQQATKIIKNLQRDGNYVPVIFLTALDDDKALSECIESGGD
ncbi:MAG: CheY-like chemotaxis protein, partial [Bermanella sp.]